MSPLVQCIYFQLPIPADETRCVGRSVRVSFLLSFSNPSVTIRIVIESSFPPPQIDAIRRHPLLLSTCASINFEGKLVNRFPLFSLTLLLLRVICTPVTREFRSWIKRHCSTSNTNERTNRIESSRDHPVHSRLTPLSWILYFMQAWFNTTNLSNILPCWIFRPVLFLSGYFTRAMLIDNRSRSMYILFSFFLF